MPSTPSQKSPAASTTPASAATVSASSTASAAKVTYDGEVVEFNGGAPKDVDHLISLLAYNAGVQSRVLLSVTVDGKEVLGASNPFTLESCKVVEAKSGTAKELFLRAIDITLAQMPNLDAAIDPVLESLLTESWQVAFGKLNGFLQTLTPFLELMANVAQYAKHNAVLWRTEFEKKIAGMEGIFAKILSASEKQAVADLTSTLNIEFRSILLELRSLLKEKVRESFVG